MNDLRTAAQQALEALRFYAEGSHHVTLTGFKNGKRIDWDQERDRLEKAGYRFSHENHNSTEEYVEDGRRARNALNNLEEALAQQAEPVQEPITRLFGTLPVHDAQQAEPVQEPVAKCIDDICSEHFGRVEAFDYLPRDTLLYTAPLQRKPLSDEEIDALPWNGSPRQFARAVEAAHGIKE